MTDLWNAILFAIVITLPNLLLMGLGFWLKQQHKITPDFIKIASDLVFQYCLPCLLFFSIIKSQVNFAQQIDLLSAGVVVTFILFLGAELYAFFRIPDVRDKGAFVQGVFRSNMAILSLATVTNAYGEQGVSVGAVYMGVITILFNILAVITLSRTHQSQQSVLKRIGDIVKNIITNPLIVALVFAFAYKELNLPMPAQPITKTGELLSAVALPLALICAGASLDFRSMLQLSGLSMQASIARIIIAPLVAVAVGLWFDLPALHLGVLFLMVASPAAASSYVMTKAMGGNAVLSANILAFTTLFSMLGMGIGAGILRSLGLM